VTDRPSISFRAVVLGAPRARDLGEFYRRLLGWEVADDTPDWYRLVPPGGGPGLSFQTEEGHVPPVWPSGPGDQQMQAHLDLLVDDLEAAGELAGACGATLAPFQPQEGVRVWLDPAGHPFCLFLPGS
jgi:catechol 2,3-dioxygenase-like lactoylglutathione lyase family enzyme